MKASKRTVLACSSSVVVSQTTLSLNRKKEWSFAFKDLQGPRSGIQAGATKLGGVVKAKLSNVRGGRMWEPHFRPQERLEDLELERHNMEFLFGEGDTCTFMRPDTFEQAEVPNPVLGLAARFLQPGMELPVEFFDGHPITVVFSDVAEARVVDTAPPALPLSSLAFTVAG